MNIRKASKQYEEWLTAYTPLIQADLDLKHKAMASAPFPFLRATFYRWIQVWPSLCRDLAEAPGVLAVGDLHVENFGTWRDVEARLIWGVNDFDEAAHLPYTQDLVRLTVSAHLAIEASALRLACVGASDAILAGYTEALAAGGEAFVLAERHGWLRKAAFGTLRDPVSYWGKMDALPDVKEGLPESAAVALEHLLPAPGITYRVKHRVAGLGSLGHPRFLALADWKGGRIAREAKALVPSSVTWVQGKTGPIELFYQAIVDRAVRCRDPYVQLEGHWIVRRLAPDCSRIELSALSEEREEAQLLHAMGWETANIHLGSKAAIKAVQQHLRKQPKGWLHKAAEAMAQSVKTDWESWKAG
jgi:hypothetical protein